MNSSKNGNAYEIQIFNVLKHVKIDYKKFNNQTESELGKSSSKNDIICLFNEQDIGIEIKKFNTPDWMQCSINIDSSTNNWVGSNKCKIPELCKRLFNELLQDINLFNGMIPPFMKKKITHDEWIKIKNNTIYWNDQYIDIPNDTILKMYQMKDCKYIQVSNYGLYHLGYDICNFNVPPFIIDQQIRIRTKVHKRKDNNEFCCLSVTAACKPKNIKLLEKSQFSLDDVNKLPLSCTYNDNF